MISPQDFLVNWNEEIYGLIHYNEKIIHSFPFSKETKDFLIKAGFPESAPPFLTFESADNDGGIRLREIQNELGTMYDKFIYFGFTGSGDPICIIEKQEKIVFLNNSDTYKEVVMNSSIQQFAECVLVYSKMIDKAVEINDEDAFIDNNIPECTISWLKEELKKIDDKCMEIESLYE